MLETIPFGTKIIPFGMNAFAYWFLLRHKHDN
jgi:hypothetical protein